MFSSNTSAVSADATYIEDVFSTYLYTGNGSTQTITNGIDLAGKGGLVWSKSRSNALSNFLCDTVRGRAYYLYSNYTYNQAGPSSAGNDITTFNSDGYSLGPNQNADINSNLATFASWTFRKQPKFFDVVTYTGDGTDGRNIAHSLGSIPGCIIIKASDGFSEWFVYHRSLPSAPYYLKLSRTHAQSASFSPWSTAPTSTTFSVNDNSGNNTVNSSGVTYVAYLFAHDAGGFGLTGADNVISCGSYTGNGSTTGPVVTLGYEPQWVLIKNASAAEQWMLFDTMRGLALTDARALFANLSDAESGNLNSVIVNATGFQPIQNYASVNTSGNTYIYIAIRRGPMKTPTSGTSVFAPVAFTGNSSSYTSTRAITVGFAGDMHLNKARDTGQNFLFADKLRGPQVCLYPAQTLAEENFGATQSSSEYIRFNNTQLELGGFATNQALYNYSSYPTIGYTFRRAPGFFDEVCYTGEGTTYKTVPHNLGVAPELMITKIRSTTGNWWTFSSPTGKSQLLDVSSTAAAATNADYWGTSGPDAANFYVRGAANTSGANLVAYLFASCPGVSKVFNFTGNGSSQTINCGFTGGARFVMIKRTDSTGDWYVWDSARGIVSGNDPRLSLNTTAAEVTTDDSVDTDSTGFVVNQLSATNVNVNGASYIGLAIA